jgi:hypothetical protein
MSVVLWVVQVLLTVVFLGAGERSWRNRRRS